LCCAHAGLSLSGRKVAVFGCGDQHGYGDYFCDAMEELYSSFAAAGCDMVGAWPTDGYEHSESKVGLGALSAQRVAAAGTLVLMHRTGLQIEGQLSGQQHQPTWACMPGGCSNSTFGSFYRMRPLVFGFSLWLHNGPGSRPCQVHCHHGCHPATMLSSCT
jgi:hypothetical protein